jgi:hypothetical protein
VSRTEVKSPLEPWAPSAKVRSKMTFGYESWAYPAMGVAVAAPIMAGYTVPGLAAAARHLIWRPALG